jgi:metal-dependent amidase/aminoacylase/carboxypeptidase family protein
MDWAEHMDEDAEQDLVRWRRDLHQHPELSFEEFETSAFQGISRSGGLEAVERTSSGVAELPT